jgi:hypothetical protein
MSLTNPDRFTTRITLTVTADAAAWNAEYGDDESRADIREALRMMALDSLTAATSHLRAGGAVVEVDRADWSDR